MFNKISIIIPTWKRTKKLKKVLYSLSNQTIHKNNYEIIVISSALQKIRKNHENIRFFNVPFNSNAIKRNLGLKVKKYPNVIFLDDDCIPSSNFIFEYMRVIPFLSNKQIICGTVKYNSLLKSKNKYIQLRENSHFQIKRKDFTKKKINLLTPATIVTMNMGFKVPKNLGYFRFDEKFGGYGFEDYEFGFRMINKGYDFIKGYPKIYHMDDRNINKYYSKFYYLGYEASKIFRKINLNAFRSTNYYKLEKFFGFKNVVLCKMVSYLLILLISLVNIFNKINGFKSNKFFKLSLILNYILGHVCRYGNLNLNRRWYS